MYIERLIALICLFLPIPLYLLVRSWHFTQIRKYPSVTSGRIVEILSNSYTPGDLERGALDTHSTHVVYEFSVMGTGYRGQATLTSSSWRFATSRSSEGNISEPGREIQVRYNPERPELSRLDDLRDKVQGGVALSIMMLLLDLGYLFIAISIGLFVLVAATRIALHRAPEFAQWTPTRTVITSLICVFIGLALIAWGINALVVNGFWAQNILWALWNP